MLGGFTMLHLTIGSKFDLELIQKISSNHRDIEISFYGAPPNFVLDGGRIVKDHIEHFYSAIDFFKKAEIQFNLCCNSVLNPNEINLNKELYDFLENMYSPLNGIIVSRHWIADEIKKRFPNFKYIFSSIGILTEKWNEDHIFSSYDIVVCPVQHTKNFKFLSNPNN
jgi:hypothetical protein